MLKMKYLLQLKTDNDETSGSVDKTNVKSKKEVVFTLKSDNLFYIDHANTLNKVR